MLYKYKQKERRSYIISHPSLISELLKFKNSLKFPNLTPKYAELLKFLGLKSSLENIIKMNIRCFTEEIIRSLSTMGTRRNCRAFVATLGDTIRVLYRVYIQIETSHFI